MAGKPQQTVEFVTAYEPDRVMRRLIGEEVDLKEIFTRARIAAGQKALDEARDNFYAGVADELAMLETLASANPVLPQNEDALFSAIDRYAGNIHAHAGLVGISLAAMIADRISGYCNEGEHTAAARYSLILNLLKFLGIVIRDKITDENGDIAQRLWTSLS